MKFSAKYFDQNVFIYHFVLYFRYFGLMSSVVINHLSSDWNIMFLSSRQSSCELGKSKRKIWNYYPQAEPKLEEKKSILSFFLFSVS